MHGRPKADERPHAFVERANVPFNLARPYGAGTTPMEVPVQRAAPPPECALCGKPASDVLHAESAQQAESEEQHWPK